MFNLRQYNYKKLNFSLIIVVLALCVVSAIVLNIISGGLFTKQLLGIILGIVVCAIFSVIDYHTICSYAVFLYAAAVVLLILVQIPGIGVSYNEATRWINLGFTKIQPSELCKVLMIIVLAQFFTMFSESISTFRTIGISFIIMVVPMLLIFIQPDLSSSMVIVFFFIVMLYSAGISYKIVVPFIIGIIPIGVLVIWYVCQPFQLLLDDYQQGRIIGLFNPDEYPDIMFQQNKSVKMVSKGKLYGIFNDGSSETLSCLKLPIVESDFIFAAISEILGFIGVVVVLILLMVLVFKCLMTAKKARDFTGKLICVGVSAMFMFQIFANVGVVTRLLPNTGLPLPFLSYGLSALLSYFIAIGMVINIGLQGKK